MQVLKNSRTRLIPPAGAEDMVRGFMWLDLAAALGNDSAKRVLDLAAQSLSPGASHRGGTAGIECKASDYKSC